MPRIAKEPEPEVFENDDYRIEYRTPYSESTRFDYKVFDKKKNTIFELKVNVEEECYNRDGECTLTFIEENTEPIYLQCMLPSTVRRKGDTIWGSRISEADKYKNEPEHIGGHREWDSKTNSYPYVKNIDDIMSIYRSLKKGDFEINTTQIYSDRDLEKRKDTVPSYTSEQGIKKVLSFMDAYIFNTEESKELLVEYMQKYPIPLKNEETKDNPQVPAKEELKNYHCGASWVNRLASQMASQSKLFFSGLRGRGGKG